VITYANTFGKSETALRLEDILNGITEERKRKNVLRRAQTLLSKFNYGVNQILLIESSVIRKELLLLWKNKYIERARKEYEDRDIQDRIIGLVREKTRPYSCDPTSGLRKGLLVFESSDTHKNYHKGDAK
jgi:hypothetical protein